MEMLEILEEAVKMGVSDIHILPEKPPMIRLLGKVRPLENAPVLSAEQVKKLIYSILYEEQIQKFEEKMELDCSFDVKNLSRFRVNVLVNKEGVAAVLRVISSKIPSAQELELGPAITKLATLQRGLVLVTGPTGSGKSTTLACLIDIINSNREEHILTIEDPIEYVYEMKKCIVNQREIGTSSHGFQEALRHALRQDPDVILVGELRDLETISLALTLAETGHIVFATLHTTDAPQTIDRIVDVFPPYQQAQVRMQVSVTLKAVICQQLLPRVGGKGRVAAREVMIVNTAIANLIREGKTHQIYSAVELGTELGMISLDRSLADLVQKGAVEKSEAILKTNVVKTFEDLIAGGKISSEPPSEEPPVSN